MKTIETRTFNSAIYGLIQFVLTFLHSVLLVPLLLVHWGEDKYGLYLSVFAFIYILRSIDFGHQSYVGNEFNLVYHIDRSKAGLILGSSIRISFALGFIELLIFMIFWGTGMAESILGLNLMNSSLLMIGVFCMVLMWCLVGSVAGVLARVVFSLGLYPETLLWGIALKILEIGFIVVAGLMNMELFHFLWIWALINLAYTIFVIRWALIHLKEYHPVWKRGSWKLGFKALRNSLVVTGHNFLEQLNTNGLIFLISKFISLGLVPVFTTLKTFANTLVQLAGLISNPLQPEMIRYHSEGAGKKIYDVIQANWLISGVLVNVPLLILMPFANWLYGLWTKDMLQFSPTLFYLLCVAVSLTNFGKSLTLYLMGINDLRSIIVMSVVRFVAVFGLGGLLIGMYNLEGIGIGLLVAEVFSSVVIPIYFTSRLLMTMRVKFSFQGILLAILPVLILGGCFVVDLSALLSSFLISTIGILLLTGIFIAQWIRLSSDVQHRLRSLAIRTVKRRPF